MTNLINMDAFVNGGGETTSLFKSEKQKVSECPQLLRGAPTILLGEARYQISALLITLMITVNLDGLARPLWTWERGRGGW